MILLYLILIPWKANNFKTGETGMFLCSTINSEDTCEQRHKQSIIYSHKFPSLIILRGDN